LHGNHTLNTAPPCGWLAASITPPLRSASLGTHSQAGAVVRGEEGSNSRAMSASAMPLPLSATLRRRPGRPSLPDASCADSVSTPPCGIAWIAFRIRLIRICCSSKRLASSVARLCHCFTTAILPRFIW
jgi:hypothetical protein